MTTDGGRPVGNDQTCFSVGPGGPIVLEDGRPEDFVSSS
jgi:hypothetical protein